jgi:tetratricopeptide (TPR) repeat protein
MQTISAAPLKTPPGWPSALHSPASLLANSSVATPPHRALGGKQLSRATSPSPARQLTFDKFGNTVAGQLQAVLDGMYALVTPTPPAAAGRALQALRRVPQVLSDWRLHARILANYGDACWKDGNAQPAADALTAAVELYVSNDGEASTIDLRVRLAKALIKSGQRTLAGTVLGVACNLVSEGRASKMQATVGVQATTMLDAGEPLLMRATLLMGVSEMLTDETLAMVVAVAAMKKKSCHRATFRAALTLLACDASLRKDLVAAETFYDKAMDQWSEEEDGHAVAAEFALFLHYTVGNVRKACGVYERAVRCATRHNDPECGELMFNAAVCYEHDADYGCEFAVKVFEDALRCFGRRATNNDRIRLFYARALASSDRFDDALEQYNVVEDNTRANPDTVQLDCAKGRGYLTLAEVHGHIGLSLYRTNDTAGAERQYQLAFDALEDHPSAAPEFEAEAGEVTAAPRKRSKMSSVVPDRIVEWLNECYGNLLLTTGSADSAVPFLEAKIQLAAQRHDYAVEAHLHMASALESIGRVAEADAIYVYLNKLPHTITTKEHRLETAQRCAWLCHYTLGDHARAVAMYELVLTVEPTNPHTLVQMAWCMLQVPGADLDAIAKLYDSAVVAIELSRKPPVDGQPHPWDECYVFGEVAVFHHDYTKRNGEAELMYREAVNSQHSSDNYSQVTANYAALLHYDQHDAAAAMVWFGKAVAAKPDHVPTVMLFADFLINTGDLARAREELLKIADIAPLEAHHKLGTVAERLATGTTFDAAVVHFCKALAEDPAAIADDELPSDEAITQLVGAAQPRHLPPLTDLLVLLHYKVRATALVAALYPVVLAAHPTEVFLAMHHARLLSDTLRRRGAAMGVFKAALAADPRNVALLDHFADFLATWYPDRLDVAESFHLQSLRFNPGSAQAHFCYASFLTHLSNAPELAERHFQAALKLDANDTVTLCCYATFLETQADAHGAQWEGHSAALYYAEDMFRRAIDIAPKITLHNVLFGCFLWRRQRMPEAWALLETAMQRDPTSIIALRISGVFLHDYHVSTTAGARGNAATATDANSGVQQSSTASTMANQCFQQALRADPTDIESLRGYARFAEDVLGDASLSAKLYSAAAKVEDARAALEDANHEHDPADFDE